MLGRNRATMRELGAIVILASLAVGFLWRCNFAGKAMVPGDLLLIMEPWKHYARQFPEFHQVGNPILDAIQQFYPWRKFAGESLRAGQIPLWNPHELCGNPFVGNNQSAVFYPETWLHAIMSTDRALGWASSLYFFISGALMYWFLRVLRLRHAACLFGAIAFMFNGFVVGWLCFPSFRSVPGWFPGMLVGFELTLRGRRSAGIALCGLFTGLQFLAGNLHISLYILIMFAAYAAFRLIGEWTAGDRTVAVQAAICAAGALFIGGLLACGQLVPTLELAGMSSRSAGATYATVLHHALAPQALLTALMPDLFGNPVDYNHWGAQLGKVYRAYTESAFYVGLAPVILAPLAFTFNRREATFWLCVVVAGALLATGMHLNAVLYYLVPVFKSLTGIGRAVLMISTGLSVLGAFGLHALLELAKRDRSQIPRNVLATGFAVGLFGLIAGLWVWMATGAFEKAVPGIGSYTMSQIGRFGLLAAATVVGGVVMARQHRIGATIILVCLAADMYLFTDKFTPAVNPDYLHIQAKSIETIRSAPGNPRILSRGKDGIHRMAPNTPMIVGLDDIQGSDSLEIGLSRRLVNALEDDAPEFRQPDPALPAIDLLGVRFVHSGEPLLSDKLTLVSDTDGYLYENPRALPRAFAVPGWCPADPEQALQTVVSAGFSPADEVFITGPLTPQGSGPREVTDVSAVRPNMNSMQLSGDFEPGQIVVLADTFYPGWRAWQGRQELAVMRADFSLRAVETKQSGGEIRFLYVPGSFWIGTFLALLALSVISGLGVAAWCGGRRARE